MMLGTHNQGARLGNNRMYETQRLLERFLLTREGIMESSSRNYLGEEIVVSRFQLSSNNALCRVSSLTSEE
jgi:hypothetical protein